MASTSIRQWPADERPMEKLALHGPGVLSNAELISIIIRSGCTNTSAVDLSKKLLHSSGNDIHVLGKKTIGELRKIRGMGMVKSTALVAAFELGRRREALPQKKRTPIRSSKDMAALVWPSMKDLRHEVFRIALLNRANQVIHQETISEGGITGTVADPRIILRIALENHATGLILCHNHPSGNIQPSEADKAITSKIQQAAAVHDIRLLDHLIIGENSYLSFADEGLL